nr:transposase family protein [Streptomyces decoyicus]
MAALFKELPGNRHDCRAFAESGVDRVCRDAPVLADGGYQGTGALVPHRRGRGQEQLTAEREADNAVHRRTRARVEHVFSRMKNWKILRDCRLGAA